LHLLEFVADIWKAHLATLGEQLPGFVEILCGSMAKPVKVPRITATGANSAIASLGIERQRPRVILRNARAVFIQSAQASASGSVSAIAGLTVKGCGLRIKPLTVEPVAL